MSAINALMGDYLRDQSNPLAINMALYHNNRPLPLTPEALQIAFPAPTSRICLSIHGLGCTESIWTFQDAAQIDAGCSYGMLLARDLGFTPGYLRYNTGLAIAENGRYLARLLDAFVAAYPTPIHEIVLIGHSMGGLVIRNACYDAELRGSAWVSRVSRMFYLGTPHTGADLARLGHVATGVLHAVPHPIPRLIGSILDRRSQGVKDLRHGVPHESAGDAGDLGIAVPWLASARHYLIAGTVADTEHPASILFGDGLVAPPNADVARVIPPEQIRLFPGMHHLRLAGDAEVYQQIRQWCVTS